MKKLIYLALLFNLLFGTAAANGVIVVDASGAGDFVNLGPAVAAANPGDVLLMKSGNYPTADPLVLPNMSLAIVADAGAVVTVGELASVGFPAGQRLVLSGLNISADDDNEMDALKLTTGAGSIRVQDCTLTASGGMGLRAWYCDDLILSRTTVIGGTPSWTDPAGYGNSGSAGLVLRSGRTAAYDCSFSGGVGENAYGGGLFCLALGGDGGSGALLYGGALLYAMGCKFEGGDGGLGFCGGEDGDGATGLWLSPTGGTLSEAYLANTIFLPGAGPTNGVLAPPYIGDPIFLNETRRELQSPAVVREGQIFARTIIGRPGDRVYLPTSLTTTWRWLPPLGVLSLSGMIDVGPLQGIIGSGTSLDILDQAPLLAAGEQVRLLQEQVFVIKATNNRLLGGAQVLFVFNSSF
jgi:hypothetical protein